MRWRRPELWSCLPQATRGPSSSTIRRPADRNTSAFTTLAVGAVDGNAGDSLPCRVVLIAGPVYCNPFGNGSAKPDISAPGVNVRSPVLEAGTPL